MARNRSESGPSTVAEWKNVLLFGSDRFQQQDHFGGGDLKRYDLSHGDRILM